MQCKSSPQGDKRRLWAWPAFGSLGLVLFAFGCAGWWDKITDRNVSFKECFVQPHPLEILRDSSNATRRAEALAALHEPRRHGGTQDEQEKYLEILGTAAKKDADPLCRLGAIQALGKYKDPRAAKILEDVYLQRLPFTSELNTVIRQQALAGLEQAENPEARHLLIRVARQPSGAEDTTYQDRQQTLDERLAAVRALGKYKQFDAMQTLVYVLENEKDVALRERAHQSLQEATGKDLPPDPKTWKDMFANPEAIQEPNLIQRVMGVR